jgi:hypothetical protein
VPRERATAGPRLAPSEALALAAFGVLLVVLAAFRQEFIGDGVRHLQGAIDSGAPRFGAPRWLLFPALAWLLLHPLAAIGLVTGVEPAIQIILALSVLSGIGYLWGLDVWLRAEGCAPRSRVAALMMAGSAMPFLVLYSDIAEVQLPATIVVIALAICRARFAQRRGGDATVLATMAAIALASLVYQAVVLALFFVPLVAPMARLRRKTVLAAAAAIALSVPAILILARLSAGDGLDLAVLTTFRGEAGDSVRASLAQQTPLKWFVALVAGPPQAIVGLWNFQGLPSLVRGVLASDTDATMNAARLGVGLALIAVLGGGVVRTRDWRLVLAALGVVALPVIRNQQYTYSKFYVLWPVLLALASLKLRPKHVAMAAAITLALNSMLVTRQIAQGRARYSDLQQAYRQAGPDDCFFTSDWGAPFGYRWPGSSAALISILWANDSGMKGYEVQPALRDCFCRSGRVWTDTTAAATDEVTRLMGHFDATTLPVADFLYRNGDGDAIGGSGRMFVYSERRKGELCAVAQR